MGMAVCAGAVLGCTFGMAPSTLMVLPTNRVITSTPLATIMDYVPLVNIMPFGMCSSLSNPTVSAATTAALGVLTPMPCVPMLTAPWAPGSVTVTYGGYPALNQASKCMCAWGGVISIGSPGVTNIMVP